MPFHIFRHIEPYKINFHYIANCFANSVLPTPVGPAKRKDPIVFSLFLRPTLDIFIAAETVLTVFSCPKISVFKSLSKFLSLTFSFALIELSGIFAIFDIVF